MSERPVLDRELNLKGIVYTGIGLAVTLVVAGALMWPLSTGLRSVAASADPPPPLLPEARERQLPPEPRLQEDPEGELVALRAAEEEGLSSYAWVEAGQTARIPIERAIEILAAEAAADAEASDKPDATAEGLQPASEGGSE